jgi:hypothetical protein
MTCMHIYVHVMIRSRKIAAAAARVCTCMRTYMHACTHVRAYICACASACSVDVCSCQRYICNIYILISCIYHFFNFKVDVDIVDACARVLSTVAAIAKVTEVESDLIFELIMISASICKHVHIHIQTCTCTCQPYACTTTRKHTKSSLRHLSQCAHASARMS